MLIDGLSRPVSLHHQGSEGWIIGVHSLEGVIGGHSWLGLFLISGGFWQVATQPFDAFSTGGVSTPSLGQAFPNEADDGQHQLAGLFSVWHTIGQVNTFGLSTLFCLAHHWPNQHFA